MKIVKMSKEKRQNWYFSFGVGQNHYGHYIKFFGTHEETRKKMVDVYELKWSMQYSEKEWNNPGESSIKFNKLEPKDKPTIAEVWDWKEIK